VYEKAGSSLQVLIYEGWYYTWAEVSADKSKPLPVEQDVGDHRGPVRQAPLGWPEPGPAAFEHQPLRGPPAGLCLLTDFGEAGPRHAFE
jgi:hypothetical protein